MKEWTNVGRAKLLQKWRARVYPIRIFVYGTISFDAVVRLKLLQQVVFLYHEYSDKLLRQYQRSMVSLLLAL